MPPADPVTQLGRLLSRQAIRRENPPLPQDGIDAAALARQAQALLQKRFSELKKLLPRSAARFDHADYHRFVGYAEAYWPTGHRHHLLDALAFGECLQTLDPAKIDRQELNDLRFWSGQKRFQIRVSRKGIHVLIQNSGRPPSHWRLYWSVSRQSARSGEDAASNGGFLRRALE